TFHVYAYDAEGHITAVDGGSCPTCNTASIYDAEGRLVHSDFYTGYSADYIYHLSGGVAAWMGPDGAPQREDAFVYDRDLASYIVGTTLFAHDDWLGNKRARSAVDGTQSGSCTGLSFGDAITCTGTGEWTWLQFGG